MTDKRQKYTLAGHKPRSHTMPLIHPADGQIGVTVEVVGFDSQEWNEGLDKMNEELAGELLASKPRLDQVRLNGKLIAKLVVGWDEEYFGMPFTPDNAEIVLGDPDNVWLVECIEGVVRNRQLFFAKPVKGQSST